MSDTYKSTFVKSTKLVEPNLSLLTERSEALTTLPSKVEVVCLSVCGLIFGRISGLNWTKLFRRAFQCKCLVEFKIHPDLTTKSKTFVGFLLVKRNNWETWMLRFEISLN